MSRYIEYHDICSAINNQQDGTGMTYEALAHAMVEIQLAPSIDIEPKRGEWVKRTHDTLIAQVNFAYCSECGQPIMHEHTRSLWSFCPNCGADMREREGE